MSSLHISLSKLLLEPGTPLLLDEAQRAIWVETGSIRTKETTLEQDDGRFFDNALCIETDHLNGASVLNFEATTHPTRIPHSEKEQLLSSNRVTLSEGNWIMRLDKVTFPAGSRAYRHVHPGPGIRYLTQGTLEINSDHDRQLMSEGMAWFEASNSPVLAIADEKVVSEFVRALVLPASFKGRPTLTLLNKEDQDKPRHQKNTRYFDHSLTL